MRKLLWGIIWLWAALPLAAAEIVVTFGGDVNFARSRQTPEPDRVQKFGTHTLDELTDVLAAEWDGDVNFINVETVVSDQDGAVQRAKQFVFRTHPAQMTHLLGLGVNAFALANNHAFDHGWSGLQQTYAYFAAVDRPERPLLFAGVGDATTAFAPKIIEVKGVRVALSALSFGSGSFAPRADRVGMAYLYSPGHYDKVLAALRDVAADIKILSIHQGTENQITLNSGQRARFLRAVEEAGVNLVLGHHPHVTRAVELAPDQDAAIFYSLGNLLFVGGASNDGSALGRNYGLLGRAYFSVTAQGTRLKAIEAVPLKGVHLKPRHPRPEEAIALLRHLNDLSARSVGSRAARFNIVSDGPPRGLMCLGGPYPPKAKLRCCRVERSLRCVLPDLM